jgi:hypothetical protein
MHVHAIAQHPIGHLRQRDEALHPRDLHALSQLLGKGAH